MLEFPPDINSICSEIRIQAILMLEFPPDINSTYREIRIQAILMLQFSIRYKKNHMTFQSSLTNFFPRVIIRLGIYKDTGNG